MTEFPGPEDRGFREFYVISNTVQKASNETRILLTPFDDLV